MEKVMRQERLFFFAKRQKKIEFHISSSIQPTAMLKGHFSKSTPPPNRSLLLYIYIIHSQL